MSYNKVVQWIAFGVVVVSLVGANLINVSVRDARPARIPEAMSLGGASYGSEDDDESGLKLVPGSGLVKPWGRRYGLRL